MSSARLTLTRSQILAFRRRAGALDKRLPRGSRSLRIAAWAGLQDSAPRAALFSIYARMEGAGPSAWEDRSLVQIWGPRHSVFVVAARDLAVFTLGVFPDDDRGRQRAENLATRLHAHLDGQRMTYGEAGRALGVDPNSLRYVSPTGTLLMRWDGARQPTIWTVPPPAASARDARLELARRYLRIYGPATPEAFGFWSGIGTRNAISTFKTLGKSLTAARTPIGDGWILAGDESAFRSSPGRAAPARLLPSGDSYFLYWGVDRELLVQDAARRRELWTSRAWPGGVLVDGEIVGTWRRADAVATVHPWVRLSNAQREAVESEAAALPLPGVAGRITVRWEN